MGLLPQLELLSLVASQDTTTCQSNATKCAHIESMSTPVSLRHWHIDTDNLHTHMP